MLWHQILIAYFLMATAIWWWLVKYQPEKWRIVVLVFAAHGAIGWFLSASLIGIVTNALGELAETFRNDDGFWNAVSNFAYWVTNRMHRWSRKRGFPDNLSSCPTLTRPGRLI